MSCRTRNKTRIYQYIRDHIEDRVTFISEALNMKPSEIIEIIEELKREGLVDEGYKG